MAAGVLYWLFQIYSIDQIVKALSLANFWGIGFIAVAYFFVIWLIDTAGVSALLLRFTGIPYDRQMLTARAASYPLSLINYGAGQATFAYFLQRLYRMPAGDIIGLFSLMTAVDLFWIVTLAFVGSFIGEHRILGVDIAPTVRIVGAVLYTATIAHLCFWLMHWEERVKGKMWQKLFGWLRQKQLFRIFHEATLRDYIRLALWRFPIVCLIVFAIYFAVWFFQGHIPMIAAVGNVPIAILIGVIPISWAGVGTSNKALIDLLAPHLTAVSITAGIVTAEEMMLAVSLLWMLTNYLCKILIGLCFLPSIQTRMSQKTLQECAPVFENRQISDEQKICLSIES